MKSVPETILCAVDLSPASARIIRFATRLASAFGARLIIFHSICTPQSRVYGNPVAERGREQRRLKIQALETVARMTEASTVPISPLIHFGDPIDGILQVGRNLLIDLVIAASHGFIGIQRMVLGTVVERMARELHTPFLVIQPPGRGTPDFPFRRIIVSCAGLERIDALIPFADTYAGTFRAGRLWVHAMESPREMIRSDIRGASYAETERLMQERLKAEIRQKLKEKGMRETEPDIALIPGHPVEAILSCVRQNDGDLVIAGVRPRKRLIQRSSTETLIRKAPCPALFIPELSTGRN